MLALTTGSSSPPITVEALEAFEEEVESAPVLEQPRELLPFRHREKDSDRGCKQMHELAADEGERAQALESKDGGHGHAETHDEARNLVDRLRLGGRGFEVRGVGSSSQQRARLPVCGPGGQYAPSGGPRRIAEVVWVDLPKS